MTKKYIYEFSMICPSCKKSLAVASSKRMNLPLRCCESESIVNVKPSDWKKIDYSDSEQKDKSNTNKK